MNIFKIFNKHARNIIKIPEVLSVGICGDKIQVKTDSPEIFNKFNRNIEGIEILVELIEEKSIDILKNPS